MLLKQLVHKMMFFSGEILNSEEPDPCEVLKGSITVVVQLDLFVDSTEAQIVSNDKRVHIVILRQVVVRKFELIDLLGIENMDILVVRRKRAVFP